jgi:DNA-binding beta-propeller fold protein YncE
VKFRQANTSDGILYDSFTGRVFAFNKRGNSVSVFGAADGKEAGTIELGGDPEFPATDGKGTVWVNLEHVSTLVRIDARKLTVTGRWPTDPCEGPGPMAIDQKNRRLLIGCNNEHVGSPMMAVADADSGKIITTAPIGPHVDATAFEPSTGLIFNANNGSVTVVHQISGPHRSQVPRRLVQHRPCYPAPSRCWCSVSRVHR